MLALLFVAVSLGAGYLTEEHQLGTRTFMSPVVVHFTSVFFLSAVALFPWHQAKFFAALIGATALIGAIISTYITIQVVRTDVTNYIEDYLAYGLLPDLGYLALLAAAVSIYLEKDFGLTALAGIFCYWRSLTSATPGTSRSLWSAGIAERTRRDICPLRQGMYDPRGSNALRENTKWRRKSGLSPARRVVLGPKSLRLPWPPAKESLRRVVAETD